MNARERLRLHDLRAALERGAVQFGPEVVTFLLDQVEVRDSQHAAATARAESSPASPALADAWARLEHALGVSVPLTERALMHFAFRGASPDPLREAARALGGSTEGKA